MADTDLQITFSGDASGAKAAAADAADAVKGLAPALAAVQQSLSQFKAALDGAFKRPDTSAVQSALAQVRGDLAQTMSDAPKLNFDPQAVVAGVQQASQQTIAVFDAETAARKAAIDQQLADIQTADLQGLLSHQQAADQTIALFNAVTAANNQANAQIAASNQQAAKAYQANWQKSVTPVIQTFGDGLLKMAQGTKSFSQVMNQVAEKIETDFVNMAARRLSSWLMTETAQTTATQGGVAARTSAEQAGSLQSRLMSFTATEKQILNNAVAAATGAYNAMASIPIIGPALGAAAAAATFTAVEAFGNLASAAGGYDIPAGVNPLVQAHAQEMILPARIANPMRSMLSDYAANSDAPSAANAAASARGGDTHNWSISAMDPRSFETYLRRNSDTLASVINSKVRGGAKIAGA